MKPPPATCAGGGITAFEGSGKPPLASECRSREISVDGGGAITDGAGRLSLGSRTDSRSGAETGGGTTATLAICTGAREPSRLTAGGAGGMILPSKAGAERALSWETLPGAGGTMPDVRAGAMSARSPETLGDGGITGKLKAGELRLRSLATLGAGAITLVGRLGRVKEECRPSAGGSPGVGLIASKFATAPAEDGNLRSGASTTRGASEPPRATRMVWER